MCRRWSARRGLPHPRLPGRLRLLPRRAVSRPTLRESLQQLVHEGALVQVPYKGHPRRTAHARRAARRRRGPDTAGDDGGTASLARPGRARHARRPGGVAVAPRRDRVRGRPRGHLTHIELHKAIWDLADSPTLRKIWPLVGSQVHVSLTVDQAVRHDPERDAMLHRRLVRVIEEGNEATIVAEVEEPIRRSVDEVLRRLTQPHRPTRRAPSLPTGCPADGPGRH